jgi:diaminohydroxyphosphoribosylaminopyrimidine deaminase/5-amino-6-(5-phosphoribosylamino)uracil reductase
VEAGARLAGAFLQQSLVHELTVFMAPKLLGSSAKPLFDLPLQQMTQAYGLKIDGVSAVGDDWRIDALLKGPDN